MGVINKIKGAFGLGQAEPVSYECDDCGGVFESTVPSAALVSCPECGGEEVTPLATKQ